MKEAKVEAELTVQTQWAPHLLEVLKPDNVDLPAGMEISAEVKGDFLLLRVVVSGDEKALLRCRSTLDEVLSQLSLALKTVGQL
jgi:hypothetical protein